MKISPKKFPGYVKKINESKIKTAAMTWEKSKTKRIKEITKLATYTEKVFTKKQYY